MRAALIACKVSDDFFTMQFYQGYTGKLFKHIVLTSDYHFAKVYTSFESMIEDKSRLERYGYVVSEYHMEEKHD